MAKIRTGKHKGKECEINSWCNDWFSIRLNGKTLIYKPLTLKLTKEECEAVMMSNEKGNCGFMFDMYELDIVSGTFSKTGTIKSDLPQEKQENTKGKVGKPTKLDASFLKVAEAVLSDDSKVEALTILDLYEEVNYKLPEGRKIDYETFRGWTQSFSGGNIVKPKNMSEEMFSVGIKFAVLIKNALRRVKQNLMYEMKELPAGKWQSRAWILERKFTEWNLKQVQEVEVKPSKKLTREQIADLDSGEAAKVLLDTLQGNSDE